MTGDRADGAWAIAWVKGGGANVVALQGDAITLRSTIASPPGSRIDGRTGAATPVRIKVHGCKRQDDGTFVIDGRTVDFTRETRAEIVALVPRAARDGEAGAGLRAARKDDVPTIAALIRELAAFEKLESEVTLDEAELAKHLFGETRHAEVTLAEVDGAVVGFALYFHSFSTFLGKPGIYLEDLFVRPEHRGKGIGKRLLVHLARLAVERGCGRLEWAVLDWNQRAIDFYRAHGAGPLDEWTVFRVTGAKLATLAASDV